ncbi:DUF4145 domain-containing protein [Chryseobacterium wangxinyae]|uniref:DUF4145 domain-containing protein n=1 Tax=Chryseobacterium sp. CY350 TaxID=2997336 RepID=UPI00226F63DC|nr:DUF4145 domain-containing protein [Chryseobacterium sp. CY350]MCY0979350.1 DUF4145 domain-containing protein [Chryseobacterium sp. CY350]WBZ97152.1 DUF4145 domain-containing protein [Chryseobacterium sp. CY350]
MFNKSALISGFSMTILSNYPPECPCCHKSTTPNLLSQKANNSKDKIYVFLSCPNQDCDVSYVAQYKRYGTASNSSVTFNFDRIIKGTANTETFSKEISELSPAFVKIYNEAYFAEQNNLLEICGVGFRKALEFLIKDYIIKKNPDKEELIKKILLGKCINEFVEDSRIKETAKRAVWLGNDHTHYVKKWESKDLLDLKLLIKLSVNWVESEIMTEALINSMTE